MARQRHIYQTLRRKAWSLRSIVARAPRCPVMYPPATPPSNSPQRGRKSLGTSVRVCIDSFTRPDGRAYVLTTRYAGLASPSIDIAADWNPPFHRGYVARLTQGCYKANTAKTISLPPMLGFRKGRQTRPTLPRRISELINYHTDAQFFHSK